MDQSLSALYLQNPEAAIRLRRMQAAQAQLQQGGDTSPIRSHWEGAGRLANALIGGLKVNAAEGEAQAEMQAGRDAAGKFDPFGNRGSLAASLQGAPAAPQGGMGGDTGAAPQPEPQGGPLAASLRGQAPAVDLNAASIQIAQAMNSPYPQVRQQAQAYAAMLPGMRSSGERDEDRVIRAEERKLQQQNWERQFGMQQAAAQRAEAAAGRAAAAGNATRTGLQPIPIYDKDGNLSYVLPRTDGTAVPLAAPGGGSYTPKTRDINVGDMIVTVDQGGNEVRRRPINVAGPARDKVLGTAEGEARVAAPAAAATADTTLTQIDGVLNHPALNAGTGMTGQVLNSIPGTPTRDFGARVDQLKGQAFLKAIDSMRGTGAISEVEGAKATAAIARLDTATGAADFRTALGELRTIVEAGKQRAADRARGGVAIPGAGGATATPPPDNRPPLSSFGGR